MVERSLRLDDGPGKLLTTVYDSIVQFDFFVIEAVLEAAGMASVFKDELRVVIENLDLWLWEVREFTDLGLAEVLDFFLLEFRTLICLYPLVL